MSKTYDRVSQLILADKQQIERAIISNKLVREHAIAILRDTKAYFDKVFGNKK